MTKVLVRERIAESGVELLRRDFDVELGLDMSPQELSERIAEFDALIVRSATGYSRRFPLARAGELLLATHVEGQPLSAAHGFPVRLVTPGYRGYHWVKWVVELEVSQEPAWLQPPLPLQ